MTWFLCASQAYITTSNTTDTDINLFRFALNMVRIYVNLCYFLLSARTNFGSIIFNDTALSATIMEDTDIKIAAISGRSDQPSDV